MAKIPYKKAWIKLIDINQRALPLSNCESDMPLLYDVKFPQIFKEIFSSGNNTRAKMPTRKLELNWINKHYVQRAIPLSVIIIIIVKCTLCIMLIV